MQKLEETVDYSGRPVKRGDTVATLNGQLTARVCDIADHEETVFVRLRPLHQPYGKGVWHAADRLVWIAAATRRKRRGKDDDAASDGVASNASDEGAASDDNGAVDEKQDVSDATGASRR